MSEKTHSWKEITTKLKKLLHPDYLHAMTKGPTHPYLGDLIFVHAGVHPYQDRAEFLTLSRRFIAMENHWMNIRSLFLTHPEGSGQWDPDPERLERRPTVVVRGYPPALWRSILWQRIGLSWTMHIFEIEEMSPRFRFLR